MFAESEAYERFMGRWSRQIAPALVKFATVSPKHAVLDVGSGTGALTSAVLQAAPGARVTGIDPSGAYVQFANQRLGTAQVRFLVGDAQKMEFPDRSFDRTLSLFVMNLIPDHTKALAEMKRVTRPGGVIAAAVWDYGEGMEMLRLFWDEVVALNPAADARDERHMPLCRSGQLAALWRAGGLEQVQEQPLTIPQPFASFDDYWSPFLGGQGPAGAYVRSLSETDRQALATRLRSRLAGGRNDQAFTLNARAWAVKGVVK
jgi:SAM-dependent methyltransferase